jgi:hypothetical protein
MKAAFAITGALASSPQNHILEDVTTLLSTSAVEDDAVMLSVAAISNSLKLAAQENSDSSANALNEVSRAQDPRRASELLQEFAMNAAESGQGIDGDTREKLIAIRDILTNETYIALEQAHRHDQDLLNKHARAINECGYKHIMHLQQDIEGQEVQLVRDTEASMYKCQGLPVGLVALQKPERFWSNWTGVNDPKYDDPNFIDCSEAHLDMFTKCNELDNFIRGLPKPNCVPPAGTTEMVTPTCDGEITGVDIDLFDWFTNMKENALFYQETWRDLKVKCDAARDYYKEICLDECARKQRIFEQAFCSYRQGLHATCREYQGCHVLNEEQFMDLLNTVMYNADGRKIDWKAIHKIECYINVLVSTETNEVRAKDLLNCEAGNLNTIETILTGFNETNYLSVIAPEINVSCWNLDVPQFIDWKECDMTSVHQYPCTEKWMDRYNGLTAPAECTECAPIPDEFQYHLDGQSTEHGKLEEYGGGWYYVNELGRSKTDMDDLTELTPGGYHLPNYVVGGLRWNEVLIQRVSQNWCDSWGSQSSYWVEEGGASMCIQSDNEHVYCMNNGHGDHSWRQQPVSHFTVNCGGENQPACDCWPKNKDNVCWAYQRADASGPTLDNVEAPRHIRILSMEEDGSVVKISFQGQEKSGVLKVGNYNAFMQDAEGCRAITPVKYRVYVRCMGCSTSEDGDFHVFDGAQFNGKMAIGHMAVSTRTHYTYEGWFRSPLAGKQRREILGGSSAGLTLVNEGAVPCLHDVGPGYMKSNAKTEGYQLHVGGSDKYGAFCFEADTWYFIAVTKNLDGEVQVFVNGRDMTTDGHKISSNAESTLEPSIGGGFIDGGQLFNLRIWDYARTQLELYTDAFSTRFEDMQTSTNGLAHWWPLTHDLKDQITGAPLSGPEARFKPVWWSDLEISGMRGGWKAGYGLPFGESACGGAGVFHQTCGAKDPASGCVYVSKDRADQCNYIGGNHITDWGCYTDVSDNCEPKLQAGSLVSLDTHIEGNSLVKQHSFELVFHKKPVVVAVMGASGPHSAHVQIFDVTKSGFSYAVQEPHGWDGKHVAETINFVAAVQGASTLTEGIRVQAGVVSTADTVGSPIFSVSADASADSVTGVYSDLLFDEAYAATPALFTGVQTMNNQDIATVVSLRQPWLVPAVKGLSGTGFQVSLDRCEAKTGVVSQPEEIGFIAITPGHGVCEKTSCYHAKFSVQHAETSGKDMGWDDRDSNLEAVVFPEHFDNNNVIAVASKSTRAGNNGGWMRLMSTTAHSVSLFVDEDTSNDEERAHISEDVGVIAFSEPFVF